MLIIALIRHCMMDFGTCILLSLFLLCVNSAEKKLRSQYTNELADFSMFNKINFQFVICFNKYININKSVYHTLPTYCCAIHFTSYIRYIVFIRSLIFENREQWRCQHIDVKARETTFALTKHSTENTNCFFY